jgi:hypothetical protein
MRYCEDYVISCAIEVWRGNETARVDYRRGEISGVTVGGIDAPERLAEVMQWASGNYRLNVPDISLPAVAPKRTTAGVMPVVAPAPGPSPAARSATKTIFGIPQSEIAAARAAAEAIMQAQGVGTPAPPEVAPPPVAVPAPEPAPAPAPVPVVVPEPVAAPAPMRGSATKTIFGVPAPQLPEGFVVPGAAPEAPAVQASAGEAAPIESETGRDRAKTGARKVAVPAPEIVIPAAAATPAAKEVGRTTQHGFEPAPAPKKVEAEKSDRTDKADKTDKTRPTRAPAPTKEASRQAPIWTYIGVGFTFGLALLGIYQLVGRLAH